MRGARLHLGGAPDGTGGDLTPAQQVVAELLARPLRAEGELA